MSLRKKAMAEVAEDRRKQEERRQTDAERSLQRHREEAKAAAEWLSGWSGMPIDPDDLQRDDSFFAGFHAYKTWLVSVDGFDLVVKQEKRDKPMLEEHTPDWRFELHQRILQDETRRIDRPADLLTPIPQVAA